jgi:hypothetical protein
MQHRLSMQGRGLESRRTAETVRIQNIECQLRISGSGADVGGKYFEMERLFPQAMVHEIREDLRCAKGSCNTVQKLDIQCGCISGSTGAVLQVRMRGAGQRCRQESNSAGSEAA